MPTATDNKIKLLSTEIREIIAYKPTWILRNGMSVYVIIVGSLIAAGFFVRYPDVIAVKVKLPAIQKNGTAYPINTTGTGQYAELYISKNNFSKVKEGQKVLLKFPAYPVSEYGSIEGRLVFISTIATDSGYLAKASLPNGLKTNQGKQIEYSEGLLVQAEVITSDITLSDRFFNRFKPFAVKH